MKPARCGGLPAARRQIEIVLDAGLMTGPGLGVTVDEAKLKSIAAGA
jgi:hypothetical protein